MFGLVFLITKKKIVIPDIDIPASYYFVIGIAVSLCTIAYFTGRIIRYLKTNRWKTVWATIVSSRVDQVESSEGSAAYTPRITYTYTVDMQEYTSERIFPSKGWNISSFTFFADKLVKKYTQGKTVQAFYDPAEPEHSCLERKMLFPDLVALFVLLCTLVISLLVVTGTLHI